MVLSDKPPSSCLNRWWVYGHRLLGKVVGIKEPAVLEIFEGVGCCVSKNNFKIPLQSMIWLNSMDNTCIYFEAELPGIFSKEILTLCIE